ncbi:MAG: Pycsar system effector family protein [Bacteriovoracia bacterium]
MDKEDKKFTLQMVNEWVQFCDSKAGIMLTLQGVILTIIFTLTSTPVPGCNPVFILFVLGIVVFGVSIVIGVNAILPILEVGAPSSKIFFGHIKTHDKVADYLTEVNKTTYSFEEDVLTQIWANSKVAWKKYELMRTAMLWGLIGFALIGASYILK